LTAERATPADSEVRASLRICGALACTTVKSTVARLSPILAQAEGGLSVPPPAAAFYRLGLRVKGSPRVARGWYVPSAAVTRWLPAPSSWSRLPRAATAFLTRHLPSGPPYRRPRPARVVVGRRLARDPRPYAHVFDRFPEAPGPPPGVRWITLRVAWPAGTPWRLEHASLSVSPAKRILARPGGWVRIPATFAQLIARDARSGRAVSSRGHEAALQPG